MQELLVLEFPLIHSDTSLNQIHIKLEYVPSLEYIKTLINEVFKHISMVHQSPI